VFLSGWCSTRSTGAISSTRWVLRVYRCTGGVVQEDIFAMECGTKDSDSDLDGRTKSKLDSNENI
jgi:hypothetical protein